MVKLEAKKESGNIIISENSFEHLLNCLDNQKFIRAVNADGLAMGEDCVNKIQVDSQAAIDDFNRQCRNLLHDIYKE